MWRSLLFIIQRFIFSIIPLYRLIKVSNRCTLLIYLMWAYKKAHNMWINIVHDCREKACWVRHLNFWRYHAYNFILFNRCTFTDFDHILCTHMSQYTDQPILLCSIRSMSCCIINSVSSVRSNLLIYQINKVFECTNLIKMSNHMQLNTKYKKLYFPLCGIN